MTINLSKAITKADVMPIMQASLGNRLLNNTVKNWHGPSLVFGMAQYIHFNSVFGGGVANLAGEISRRKDIFRDSAERIEMIADQSVEVAAHIFFAAVDEFARNRTHRTMAKDTLRGLVQYFDYDPRSLKLMPETSEAIEQVSRGYCLNQASDETDLLRAIGFHMGSELLADEEFNIIDRELTQNQPALVLSLKAQKAYQWIQVHTTVEADHFDAAVASANCALKYYTGSPETAKSWILDGFGEFARVQEQFMKFLADKSNVGCAYQSNPHRPTEVSKLL